MLMVCYCKCLLRDKLCSLFVVIKDFLLDSDLWMYLYFILCDLEI